MNLNLNNLQKLLLSPNLSEVEIIRLLQTIHQNFTINRDEIGNYPSSAQMVSAYTLFYLPTNILKLPFVLKNLDQEVLDQIKKTTIIDVGCGPGTYSLGFLNFFWPNFEGTLVLFDKSNLMLKQASNLIDHFFPTFKKVTYLDNLPPKLEGEITLFFGNSLNELGVDKALDLVEKFKPKFLFFIEPGTKDFFKIAIKIRNEMIKKGHSVLFPCPSLVSSCPLENKDDWCHQILHTTLDPSLERLSQLIKKDRRTMPFTSHIYHLDKPANKGIMARLVRVLKENKFAFYWEVCFEENRTLLIKKLEIIKKNIPKATQKKIKNLSIGGKINFSILKKISQNYWRVEIKDFGFLD